MTHTAKLKLNDNTATGYHCIIGGKHYLILDDAEIVDSQEVFDIVIAGFVEIEPETLQEVV